MVKSFVWFIEKFGCVHTKFMTNQVLIPRGTHVQFRIVEIYVTLLNFFKQFSVYKVLALS